MTISSSRIFCLIIISALFAFSPNFAVAQTSGGESVLDEENDSDLPPSDVTHIAMSFTNAVSTNIANANAANLRFIKSLDDFSDKIIAAFATTEGILDSFTQGAPIFFTKVVATISDRPIAALLTQAYNQYLNEVSRAVVNMYNDVPDATSSGTQNLMKTNAIGSMSQLYDLHVGLFCLEGSKNIPADKCGALRKDTSKGYGVVENEKFIDFFLSDRTWPQKTVLDVMALARAYFGFIPDRSYAPVSAGTLSKELNPGQVVREQTTLAQNNLRMAALNYLAARRAPSNTSATATIGILMQHVFGPTGKVPAGDFPTLCGDIDATLTKLPGTSAQKQSIGGLLHYMCGFAKPKEGSSTEGYKGYDMIMSEAAYDSIMTEKVYLSPFFYDSLYSGIKVEGAIDRMEVMALAQRVVQDYNQLQLLKYNTALLAMKMNN